MACRRRPVLGSGSNLIAKEKTGPVCRGVEFDPVDVDVIVRRYEAATGNPAVLGETDETFEALGAGQGSSAASSAGSPAEPEAAAPSTRPGACSAEVTGSKSLSSTKGASNLPIASRMEVPSTAVAKGFDQTT
jgi:hypothetical protein